MASRAHVIHDYSFVPPQGRPRRPVVYRADDDPVVLPRSKSEGVSLRSVIAALIASGLVVGTSYALFSSPSAASAKLGKTAAAPLSRDWQPDLDLERANVTNELSGPALAVPSVANASSADLQTDSPTSPRRPDEVIINDSLQLRSDAPPSAPAPEVRPAPYPNPSTTPPEGIAAPDSSPSTPAPDAENPYR